MAELFDTQLLEDAPVVTAPDGSAVRPLCRIAAGGSFAHFQLEPGEVSRAVSHATVQEIWYVVAGAGQLWRRDEPLRIVAVTMPPWPDGSDDEARPEDGTWRPALRRPPPSPGPAICA
jgi:hypothetical protein